MTPQDKKLAEEILKGCEHDGSYIPVREVKRLMQSYHEAKLKEITDFNCKSCGEPLNHYCDNCQHLWET